MAMLLQSNVGRQFRCVLSLFLLISLTSGSAAQFRTPAKAGAGISPDLLQLYATTQTAKSIEDFDVIVTGCTKALSDSRRSEADRNYANDLLAWAANRRGETRSDLAADAVTEGRIDEAAKIDQAALQDFELSLQHDPKRWRSRHNLAIALAMQKRYDEAIHEFSQVIQQNSKYPNAYYNRGELYFLAKEYDLAIADFTAAIRLNPSDAAALSSRGHAKFLLDQYDSAIADYQQASKLDPQNIELMVDLADAYQSLSRWNDAVATYALAIDRDPNHVRALQNVAWLFATCPNESFRDGPGAIEIAQRMMDVAKETSYRHWDVLAAAQATQGEFPSAVKSLGKAIASAPSEERTELEERMNLYKKRRIFLQEAVVSTAGSLNQPTSSQPTARTASQAVGTGIRRP